MSCLGYFPLDVDVVNNPPRYPFLPRPVWFQHVFCSNVRLIGFWQPAIVIASPWRGSSTKPLKRMRTRGTGSGALPKRKADTASVVVADLTYASAGEGKKNQGV